jgi:hypothetical protein
MDASLCDLFWPLDDDTSLIGGAPDGRSCHRAPRTHPYSQNARPAVWLHDEANDACRTRDDSTLSLKRSSRIGEFLMACGGVRGAIRCAGAVKCVEYILVQPPAASLGRCQRAGSWLIATQCMETFGFPAIRAGPVLDRCVDLRLNACDRLGAGAGMGGRCRQQQGGGSGVILQGLCHGVFPGNGAFVHSQGLLSRVFRERTVHGQLNRCAGRAGACKVERMIV